MPVTLSLHEIWIVNAAPFIGLAKIGRLELLSAEGRSTYLPEAVAREIEAGREEDAAVKALAAIVTRKPETIGVAVLPQTYLDPRLLAFTLDAGEAAVLTEALAREDCLCIIDDRPGRSAAKALGLDVTGTVGILLQARREGQLSLLTPELLGLQAAGLYLPREDILRNLLAGFGEKWP